MSLESRVRQYGVVLGGWKLREKLGSGSSGKTTVYAAYKDVVEGKVSQCAIKVVNVFQENSKREELS